MKKKIYEEKNTIFFMQFFCNLIYCQFSYNTLRFQNNPADNYSVYEIFTPNLIRDGNSKTYKWPV